MLCNCIYNQRIAIIFFYPGVRQKYMIKLAIRKCKRDDFNILRKAEGKILLSLSPRKLPLKSNISFMKYLDVFNTELSKLICQNILA